MTLTLLALCLFFAASLSVGQIALKIAASDLNQRFASMPWFEAAQSPRLIAALAIYGAVTALWLYVLTRLPLSQAYPFSLFGSAIVPIAAWLWLGEALTLRYGIGLALMIVGLFVMYAEA